MSTIDTRLQEIRTNYQNDLDASENRMSQYGLLEGVQADTKHPKSVVSSAVREAFFKSAEASAFKIPVLNKSTPAIANVRSCTIPTPAITSGLVTVTSTVYFFGFAIPKSIAADNLIDWQKEWQKQYDDHADVVLRTIETSLAAALSTNKSQKELSGLTGAATKYGDFETADQIDVTLAQRNLFYNDIPTIMSGNDFYAGQNGNFNVFGSNALRSDVNYIGNQGGGNSTNLAYQIPGIDHHFSNRIVPGAGESAVFYIVPKGQTAIMERVPFDFRNNVETTDGDQFGISTEPYSGFQMGTLYRSRCSDVSGWQGETYTGQTASVLDYYGFLLDVGIVMAYNSAPTTTSGPIFKVAFKST